jgi:hypothetical protein
VKQQRCRTAFLLIVFLAVPTIGLADNCGTLVDCYDSIALGILAAIGITLLIVLLPEVLPFLEIGAEAELGGGLLEGELGGLLTEGGEVEGLAVEEGELGGLAGEAPAVEEGIGGVAVEEGELGALEGEVPGEVPGAGKPGTIFNPSDSRINCGPVADAVDDWLAGRGLQPAPNIGPQWPLNAPVDSPGWNFANPTSPTGIENTLRLAGDEARGIAYVGDGTVGHYFNVVNQGGNIVAIDGQINGFGTVADVVQNAGYWGDNIEMFFHMTFPP